MDAAPVWGVTALQAVDEMDAGPIWASSTFPVDPDASKSALYNGPVTETAMALIHDVVAKAADPAFRPEPLDYTRPDVPGRPRPPVRRTDRSFSWSQPTQHILRRIRAADGTPGAPSHLCGLPVTVYDAHRGQLDPRVPARPGTVLARRHGAVLVRTGDGAIWIGHLRSRADAQRPAHKLPATTVLADRLTEVPEARRSHRIPRDHLPPRRPTRRAELPVLQRRHVHRSMPQAARRPAPRHRTRHPRAAPARQPTLLQRHPPGRHRRRTGPGRRGLGQHQRHRRRLPGDHHLRPPTGGVLDRGQRGRRWRHAGAGRRPGYAPRRRRAQPALPDHGTVRIRVLDLCPSPAGRQPAPPPR